MVHLNLERSPAKAGVQARREAPNALPRAIRFDDWTPAYAGEQGGLA
jgi:hypothetical protein